MESYSSLYVIIGTIALITFSYSLKGQTKTVVNKDTTLKEFISNTSIKGYSLEQIRSYYKRHSASIECVLPPSYDCYFKIMHPFKQAVNLTDKLVSEKEFENRIPIDYSKSKPFISKEDRSKDSGKLFISVVITNTEGQQIDILEKRQQQIEWYKKQDWKTITWKSIANKYEIAYTNQITTTDFTKKFNKVGYPYNISFPEEGRLPMKEFEKLIKLLSKDTANKILDVFMRQPKSNTNNFEDAFLCNISDIAAHFDDGFVGYLSNTKKDWLLFTDSDLQYSIFACNKALADLLVNDGLEVLKCKTYTRL